MSVLSKKDWAHIEKKLNHSLFGAVMLKHGDDLITVQHGVISENIMGYKVFINHDIKGVWINEPTDLVKQFWQQTYKYVYSRKMIKSISKRTLKEMDIDANKKTIFYQPYFKSFRKLKSQYSKIDGLALLN